MAVAPAAGSGATATAGGCGPPTTGLPERARVHWRARVDGENLRRRGRAWTLTTFAHSAPFIVAALALAGVKPLLIPVAIVLLVHAWAIPELYAAKGAGVLRARPAVGAGPEARALLLLGDLIDDAGRTLHAATGLVLQAGELGVWIVGEAGAVLVRPRARRVYCYCVRVTDKDLPHGDRVAHLLLALRCDERDFATVANLAFSGACWRLRRRLEPQQRPALTAARNAARVPLTGDRRRLSPRIASSSSGH